MKCDPSAFRHRRRVVIYIEERGREDSSIEEGGRNNFFRSIRREGRNKGEVRVPEGTL
jgi:hypothetical protein